MPSESYDGLNHGVAHRVNNVHGLESVVVKLVDAKKDLVGTNLFINEAAIYEQLRLAAGNPRPRV